MFRSLFDHHQALRIKSVNAGYMLGSQLCLKLVPVYYIVCEATCFGPYVTIIRPSYESSQ